MLQSTPPIQFNILSWLAGSSITIYIGVFLRNELIYIYVLEMQQVLPWFKFQKMRWIKVTSKLIPKLRSSCDAVRLFISYVIYSAW